MSNYMGKQSWLLPLKEFLVVWAKAGQHQADTTVLTIPRGKQNPKLRVGMSGRF